jgi:hypothetical protein
MFINEYIQIYVTMMQPQIMPQIPSLIIGLLALALGAYPLLIQFGIIPALFEIPAMVYHITLVVGGLILMLDYLLGFSLA